MKFLLTLALVLCIFSCSWLTNPEPPELRETEVNPLEFVQIGVERSVKTDSTYGYLFGAGKAQVSAFGIVNPYERSQFIFDIEPYKNGNAVPSVDISSKYFEKSEDWPNHKNPWKVSRALSIGPLITTADTIFVGLLFDSTSDILRKVPEGDTNVRLGAFYFKEL